MELSREELIRVLNYTQELRLGKGTGNSCGNCGKPLGVCKCAYKCLGCFEPSPACICPEAT